MLIDYFLYGCAIICFIIVLCFIIGIIISGRKPIYNSKSNKDNFDLTDYASKREKMLLQPIITNSDTPKIISNGDGSFHSDEIIKGESHGTLALSNEERVSMAKSGWHDTGLVNGHGQPLVQNEKGEILSVCRYLMPHNYSCNVFVDTKIDNLGGWYETRK